MAEKVKSFIGARVVKVRKMTQKELDSEGWDYEDGDFHPATAIELDDGTVIYASCDEEGNSNGCLFGYNKNTNEQFMLG